MALIAASVALSAVTLASQAFAECDEDAQDAAGRAVAVAASAKVSQAVTVQGKQMLSIDDCNATSAGLLVTYKYNFLAADGLYWVMGSAKVNGTNVSDLKVTMMSPNLSAASAAKGVKLASN